MVLTIPQGSLCKASLCSPHHSQLLLASNAPTGFAPKLSGRNSWMWRRLEWCKKAPLWKGKHHPGWRYHCPLATISTLESAALEVYSSVNHFIQTQIRSALDCSLGYNSCRTCYLSGINSTRFRFYKQGNWHTANIRKLIRVIKPLRIESFIC